MIRPQRPNFQELPASLPVFPLSGVLLLPRGQLPLNIFEPRYLAMIDDALASHRLIGMIQPQGGDGEDEDEAGVATDGRPPPLFDVGCAGRITSFDETDDGRYLITLTGVCRFRAGPELPLQRGYRRVQAHWAGYEVDFVPGDSGFLDRARLRTALTSYFQKNEINANWKAIDETPDERLVTSLSMICPFSPTEKQALLERLTIAERAEALISLLEMAVLADGDEPMRH